MKGMVHPSPPIISDHMSFLPAVILSLVAAVSTQDREVLTYPISCSFVNAFHGHRKNTTHRQKTISFAKPEPSVASAVEAASTIIRRFSTAIVSGVI
ncbi:hypothetical protein Dsin_002543 [Dipteronia sinensis]|uniref:Secreted protein n=1 Tax=Dipteronia sinensis TaxID=43782 RepID=A0AAE0EK28_9ROSI|nr:hypothetical protein Dsin_002543 [Dipteronia sinensis]